MAAEKDYSASGMPPEDVPAEPSVVNTILSGPESLPVTAATPRQQRLPKRIIKSADLQSATCSLIFSQSTPTAQSPRPAFISAWAVKDHEDENEAGASFHDGSHRTKTNTNLLDDWDSLLRASSNACSVELMDFVKAFFLTSGFRTPRMIVNLSEHLILRLMQDAANQDSNNPKIFSPHTIREEVAISETVLIAKQLN